jgi:hypothetical protein
MIRITGTQMEHRAEVIPLGQYMSNRIISVGKIKKNTAIAEVLFTKNILSESF